MNFSARYGIHTAEHIEKSGLARSRRAEQNAKFSFIYFKACVGQCIDLCRAASVAFGYVFKLDIVFAHIFTILHFLLIIALLCFANVK